MCHKHKQTRLTLGALIEWSGGTSTIPVARRSRLVSRVWNDSRKVEPGDLFVAIKTDRDDGHKYVTSALASGAVGAIVARGEVSAIPERHRGRLIVVKDPLAAVQKAAARYRRELGILMIGVTGSNGKTTTRAFVSSVLRSALAVGETFGNWNNHIGVPLSILRFTGEEWAGVIEMGANHVGEIHDLSMVTRPDIAIITNIGYGHVGLFGSLSNTESAKFEIADGLDRRDGFMLLNGDDPRLVAGAARRGLRAMFYGYSSRCDIRPADVRVAARGGMTFVVDGSTFRLSMPGRHFVYSALPAIFVGRRCGIPDDVIAGALAAQKPVAMRGTLERRKGATFIVDCYNANPSSMQHAIALLDDIAQARGRVAVVGDMLELGKYSARLHTELGKRLAKAGVARVVAVGQYAPFVARGARASGVPARSIVTVPNADEALAAARKMVRPGDTVLLKGSRGVHLESVFERF